MFPFGNNVDHASFYLEQGFPDGKPPDDFVASVQFGLVLWNPDAPEIFTHHTAHHRFTKEEGDWGLLDSWKLESYGPSLLTARGAS